MSSGHRITGLPSALLRFSTLCEITAAIALGVALLAAWTHGWHAEVLGASISVRALWRPLVVATVALIIRGLLLRREPSPVVSGIDSGARVAAGALVVAGVLSWTTYLSPTVGGADSHGYVAASDRLRAGALIQAEPLAGVLPFPGAIRAATPLGFVPAARMAEASAPMYPLGLPALMALATTVLGSQGPFYVSLLMGIVLLTAAYHIALRWFADRVVALTTCAALAFYPVVFAYAIQPMSDVPATAWFLVAVACLISNRRGLAWLAGVAAGAALLTRPASLPGLLVLGALCFQPGGRSTRFARSGQGEAPPRHIQPIPVDAPPRHDRAPLLQRLTPPHRAVAYLIPLGVSVVIQGWVQWYLYGSVLTSGYGTSSDLFSTAFVAGNARSHGYWAAMVNGPIWIAGLLAGLFVAYDRSARIVMTAVVVGAILPYVIYRPYDHWETLRFLLPLLVVATIVSTGGVMFGSRRLASRRAGTVLGLILTIGSIAMWIRWLDREQVLIMGSAEERYRLAGEMVARVTPADAVVLTSLHSGSIRYYAQRGTVDWAHIPADQFAPSVSALQQHGHPVFLLIDGAEAAMFDARHGPAYASWLPAGQRRDIRLYEAR